MCPAPAYWSITLIVTLKQSSLIGCVCKAPFSAGFEVVSQFVSHQRRQLNVGENNVDDDDENLFDDDDYSDFDEEVSPHVEPMQCHSHQGSADMRIVQQKHGVLTWH